MAKHPGLMPRGRRWYLRAKVPVDLRDFLSRQEVWRSLGIGDHREAVKRFRRARADLDQWFERQRRRRDIGERLNGEAPRLVTQWFHETERKAAHRDFGLVGDLLHMARAEADQDLFDLLDGEVGADVQAAVDRVLVTNGWPLRPYQVGTIPTIRTRTADAPDEHRAALTELVRRALIELARRRLDRLQGKPNGGYDPMFSGAVPVQPGAPDGQDPGLTVGELIARFRAEKEPAQSAKLRSDYNMLYEVLADLWGEALPARSIARQHCRQVRDLFAALPANAKKRLRGKTLSQAAEYARQHAIAPMTAKTANQHLTRLSTMLKWARREQFITQNHAEGLTVSAPEIDARSARRPLTIEQLRRLFHAPLYTGCQDDQYGYMVPGPNVIRRGRFWIPLVCVYSGLRMGEACQLGVDDLEIEHGVHVLQVRPDPEAGTRLKTKHSCRTVPVHEELIRIGLLAHTEEMRRAGETRLFPELPRDRRGSYAGHFQRWANRFLERAGAEGERQSFHSTRHAFVDALRRANATGEMIDDLLGWTRGNMRDRYGSGPWLRMLADVMARVRYEGLDLSHLHTG